MRTKQPTAPSIPVLRVAEVTPAAVTLHVQVQPYDAGTDLSGLILQWRELKPGGPPPAYGAPSPLPIPEDLLLNLGGKLRAQRTLAVSNSAMGSGGAVFTAAEAAALAADPQLTAVYTIRKLVSERTYQFRVAAANKVGQSVYFESAALLLPNRVKYILQHHGFEQS
jgi:hypothetical protein